MTIAYTIVVPTPAGVPASVEVHVTAMRVDGRPLTREELVALAIAYPPPTEEGRAALTRAIATASPATPKVGAKPHKAPGRRAAAKRPR